MTYENVPSFDYVIIGAGPAGCAAAARLVDIAGACAVAVIGEEPYAAYERPLLSKEVLCDDTLRPVPILASAQAIVLAGVTTLLSRRVVAIDPDARIVSTDCGEKIRYRRLLIATGATPRPLTIPGADLGGVHLLRTWEHAQALRTSLQGARHVVVVGGGFIGLEAAASARKLGADVTVLEAADRLLARAMPEVVSSAVLAKFHAEGVHVRFGARVECLEGEDQVQSVVLADGTRLRADVVVVGIGVVPNTDFMAGTGIQLNNGILTDAEGRTSDPHIFAVGDVANRLTRCGPAEFRCRLEAWEPACEHGAAAADSMSGGTAPNLRAPWVWSDLFDWNLQSVGNPYYADTQIVRGEPSSGKFTVFQLAAGRIVSAITVNSGRDMVLCRRAVDQGSLPEIAVLQDVGLPLRQALMPTAVASPLNSALG